MNKYNFFRVAFGVLCFFCLVGVGFSQALPGNRIRLYNHPMNPRQHPDDLRRAVQPPDNALFGNQTQFSSLRTFDKDYISTLDTYTLKYNLGNILWPDYSLLYRDDLKDIVGEIKNRGLFLFDLWGYVPGSGPGTAGQKNELGSVSNDSYCQQFMVPPSTFSFLEKELGPHWLGMDNGEQDGRYIGGFADQMSLIGSSRERQYLNFQNHFQGLGDRLGNKLATLVSLNFGHYFLKEGIYTLIGAETAMALPNSQVYYSFIRGAGKQYGVPWFGSASIWNRWGESKSYQKNTTKDKTWGETKGTSLSLLKRLMVNHIMYNCVFVGFETGFFNSKGKLSPIGKIQQSANQWVHKYGTPGTMYTPVAVMCDFFSGWSFPRHLYTNNVYRVWGNLPYGEGDYLTDGIFNLLYPEYQDASYFHDESGFISHTPYGDISDCILSDAPLWILKQYPVLVIGGKINGGHELKDKLEEYVRSGGKLVITAGNLENLPDGLLGVKTGPKEFIVEGGASVEMGAKTIKEESGFTAKEIVSTNQATILATCREGSLVLEYAAGLGKMVVIATPFGTGSVPGPFPESEIDKSLVTPYPLLKHVNMVMDQIFLSTEIFNAGEGLSLITCSKNKNEYTVAIGNNSWKEKPFAIGSNSGIILSITELPLDCSERKAAGFVPEVVTGNLGKNTKRTIAGGDVRVFSVKLETNKIDEKPEVKPVQNPENRGLTLRNIVSVKEEILLRPTFFQHFDRVVIDWKYLAQKEESVLREESGWIKRQGLKLIVDFSSGVNLFPDLRLLNNHPEYAKNRETIFSVIRKMNLMGAKDMILPIHRMVENNLSEEQFNDMLQSSIREICREAAQYQIDVHLKSAQGGAIKLIDKLTGLVDAVNEPNLYFAPSTGMILYHRENFAKVVKSLKDKKFRICFISAPEVNNYGKVWNVNCPVYRYSNQKVMKELLDSVSESTMILDGIYPDKDQEYLDIKIIENP